MKIKRREKLPTNNKEHIGEKQNTFLQFETFTYYKNRYIRSYYKSRTFTRKRINNIHVKNYKLDRTKLQNLEKRNDDHYLDS